MKTLFILLFGSILLSCSSGKPKDGTAENERTTERVEADKDRDEDDKDKAEEADGDRDRDKERPREHDAETPSIGAVYERIHNSFEGLPPVDKIRPLVEVNLKACNIAPDAENLTQFANTLITLRQKSAAGVTEMAILENMNKKGTSTDLATRVSTAAASLEHKKQSR